MASLANLTISASHHSAAFIVAQIGIVLMGIAILACGIRGLKDRQAVLFWRQRKILSLLFKKNEITGSLALVIGGLQSVLGLMVITVPLFYVAFWNTNKQSAIEKPNASHAVISQKTVNEIEDEYEDSTNLETRLTSNLGSLPAALGNNENAIDLTQKLLVEILPSATGDLNVLNIVQFDGSNLNVDAAAADLVDRIHFSPLESEQDGIERIDLIHESSSEFQPQSQPPQEFRIWTSADGKMKVEAKLLKITSKSIILIRRNGKKAKVSFAQLSSEDLEFLQIQIPSEAPDFSW